MNKIKTFLLTTIALVAMFLAAPKADAQIAKTFWSAGTTAATAWTNVTGVVTNLNAAGDFSQVTDFALVFNGYGTNNSGGAGSFDVVWESSVDGSNYPKITNVVGRTCGWFAIPYQSNNVQTVWITNITVDAIPYWRIRHVTNNTGTAFTNISITAYIKPARTRKDY